MTDRQEYMERRWIALILLCFAQFIVVLDASIVNVALPSIGEALDFSRSNLAWVVNAYVLTLASCCSAAAWPICSAAGACSSRGCCWSPPPRWRPGSPPPRVS
jgi:MFS family permease